MVNRKSLIVGAVFVLGMVAVLGLYFPGIRPEPLGTRTVTGTVDIGGPFTLVDQRGQEVTEASLKGRYALVFFGFTNCPDICPLTLQIITQALEIAGPLGEDVVPVFITVDPERDTPDLMGQYIANFHPRFRALTGTAAAAKQAADGYRVFFRKAVASAAASGDPSSYMMEHSGFVYFMGRDGAYITHFGTQTTAEAMAARIRQETSPSK
jgi:cytochrome oxidase Cu insertion factor (SCO1/SenC/PrrC family)